MQHEADDSTEAQPSIGQRRRKPYVGKLRTTLNVECRDGGNFGVDEPAPWLQSLLTPHSAVHRIRHTRQAGWGALRALFAQQVNAPIFRVRVGAPEGLKQREGGRVCLGAAEQPVNQRRKAASAGKVVGIVHGQAGLVWLIA